MISMYLQGGLGNQLFQIFTAIAYAMEQREKLVFPEFKADHALRPTYWDTILKRMKDGVDPKLNCETIPKIIEETFHYTPIPIQSNVMLVGYYQSYKYFEKQFEAIYKKLNLKMEQELVRTKYLTLTDTISLHFRIGDYTTLQLHHTILKDDYYVGAIQEILKRTRKPNWNIVYFCEEKDNIPVKQRMRRIKNCRNNNVFNFKIYGGTIRPHRQWFLCSMHGDSNEFDVVYDTGIDTPLYHDSQRVN